MSLAELSSTVQSTVLSAIGLILGACQVGDSVGVVPFGTGLPQTDSETSSTSADGSDGVDGDNGDGDGDPASTETESDSGTIFDVGAGDGDGDTGDDGSCGLPHVPCDAATTDPFRAMGLDCPGELAISTTIGAHPAGLGALTGFGENSTFDPREGSSFTVISTGHISELGDEPSDAGDQIYHCNKWFEPNDGMDTSTFPAPILAQDVVGDCLNNPNLVGTGDCSNTIAAQFDQSGAKYDYQEIRVSMTVPADAHALSFDVAYMTTEWPVFAGQAYNDMFVAWLEASNWTGNISFDDNGNALSLNAAFFDFQDVGGDLPEFAGTCLRYGAGTPWLTSTVEVVPGDEIELVFAVFDLADVNLDSLVFLDNFQWLCEGGGGPSTVPVG